MSSLFQIGDLVVKRGGNVLWIVTATAADQAKFGAKFKPEFRRLAANSIAAIRTRDQTRTGDLTGRYFLQSNFQVVGRIAPEHITLIHLGRPDLIPEYELEPKNQAFGGAPLSLR